MPIYDYRCTQCGATTEVRHGFNERYETPCSACGGPVARVFNPAPIVFKGSGFYVTDSRPSKSGTSSSSTEKKADSAPAASTESSSTESTSAKSSESAA